MNTGFQQPNTFRHTVLAANSFLRPPLTYLKDVFALETSTYFYPFLYHS